MKKNRNRLFDTCRLCDVADIGSVPTMYHESPVDDIFPKFGITWKPIIRIKLRYDTIMRYNVTIVGNINFKHNKSRFITKDKKSISLKRIYISKMSYPRRMWILTEDSIISPDNCPISYDFLLKIKQYFLFVNKYLKIDASKEYIKGNSFQVANSFKLY